MQQQILPKVTKLIYLVINHLFYLDVLIIQPGTFCGDPTGGAAFDDAVSNSLTLTDKVVSVQVEWAYDTLSVITFIYSNGGKTTHGIGDAGRPSLYSDQFTLVTGESFNAVTVYSGIRPIINPYAPNGTFIIVGLQLFTDKGRQTDLFGSSNGTQYNEVMTGYVLAYIRGRSYAFIDGIQFMWDKGFTQSLTSPIANA